MSATAEALRRAQVAELAELCAFAARVDPTLLRVVRTELLPASDASLEADLWLSAVARSASASGFVMDPVAARALRRALLARDPDLYDGAWRITERCHAHLAPAIRAEEELGYLEALAEASPDAARRADARRRSRELLRSAIAAIVAGGQAGLAHWAARLLARSGESLAGLEEAAVLDAGARLRVDGALPSSKGAEAVPSWLPWLVPSDLPREEIAVRLREGEIEIGPATLMPEAPRVALPRTDPLVVELAPAAGAAQRIELAKDRTTRVRVPPGTLRLRTVLGEVFDLEAESDAATRLDDEILGVREELDAHAKLSGRPPFDPLEAPRGAWRWIVGRHGAGKSALAAHCVRVLRERKIPVAFHCVRRDLPEWNDPGAALRSLAAQLEKQLPSLAEGARATTPASTRLERLLARASEGASPVERVVLVIDGLDPRDPRWSRFAVDLPARASVLAFALPEAVRDVARASVLDLDDERLVAERRAAIGAFLSDAGLRAGDVDDWHAATAARNLAFAQEGRIGDLQWESLMHAAWDAALDRVGEPLLTLIDRLAGERELLPKELLGEEERSLLGDLSVFGEERLGRVGLRPEPVRQVWSATRRQQVESAHARLAEGQARWPPPEDAPPALVRYAARNALWHAVEGGLPGVAAALQRDVGYLQARIEAEGVAAVAADEHLEAFPVGEATHPLARVDAAARALVEADPRALPEALFGSLTAAEGSRDEDAALARLRFPPGRPLLRARWNAEPRDARVLRWRSGTIEGAAFAEEGQVLVAWTREGNLLYTLADELTGPARKRAPIAGQGETVVLRAHEARVTCGLALEGPRFATGAEDGAVAVHDLLERTELHRFHVHGGPVRGLLAVGDTVSGTRLITWSRAELRQGALSEGSLRPIALPEGIEIAFVAPLDGASGRLLVGTTDGRLLFGGLGEPFTEKLRRPGARPVAAAQPPNGTIVVVGFDDGVLAGLHAGGGTLLWETRAHALGVLALDADPSGEVVASASLDGAVRVAHLSSGEEIAVHRGHEGAVTAVRFLQGEAPALLSGGHDGTIRMWDRQTGTHRVLPFPFRDSVRSIAIGGDGSRLVAVAGDGAGQLWSLRDVEAPHWLGADGARFRMLLDAAAATAPSPSEPWLVQWPAQGLSTILDLRDGGRRGVSEDGTRPIPWSGHPSGASTIGWSEGVLTIAAGGDFRRVQAPDVSGAAVDALGEHGLFWNAAGEVFGFAASGRLALETPLPGGSRVVAAAVAEGEIAIAARIDGTIDVWRLFDVATRRSLHVDAPPVDVALSSDGRFAAVATRTNDVIALDLSSLARLFAVHLPGRHSAWDVRGEPRSWVLGSDDGSLTFLDDSSGKTHSVRAHAGRVTALFRTGDRAIVVSGGDDGVLALWNAGGTERLAAVALGSPIQEIVEASGRICARDAEGRLQVFERPGVLVSYHGHDEEAMRVAHELETELARRGIVVVDQMRLQEEGRPSALLETLPRLQVAVVLRSRRDERLDLDAILADAPRALAARGASWLFALDRDSARAGAAEEIAARAGIPPSEEDRAVPLFERATGENVAAAPRSSMLLDAILDRIARPAPGRDDDRGAGDVPWQGNLPPREEQSGGYAPVDA